MCEVLCGGSVTGTGTGSFKKLLLYDVCDCISNVISTTVQVMGCSFCSTAASR